MHYLRASMSGKRKKECLGWIIAGWKETNFVFMKFTVLWQIPTPLPILPFLSPFQDEGWCSSKLLPVKRMSRPKPLWLYFLLYPSFQQKLLVVGHLLKPLVTHVLTWLNKSSPHPSFKLGEKCEETGREEMTQKMEQRWGKGIDRKQANRMTKLLFSVIENFTLRKLGNLGLLNRMIKERYYYLRTIT